MTPPLSAMVAQELPQAMAEARSVLIRAVHAPGFSAYCQARFAEGAKEHNDDWLSYPDAWFEGEAAEEIADLVLYCAMRRVARFARGG